MALLTSLSQAQAAELLAGYGLELAQIEALTLGSVNSNFRLRTRDGRWFFARLYEEQGFAGATREVVLLQALVKLGLPVAEPLSQVHGEHVALFEGKAFAVFPWIDGTISCQGLVSPARAQEIGHALARLHTARVGLPQLGEGRFGVPEILQRLEVVTRNGGAGWEPVVAGIRSKLLYYQSVRDNQLPKGVIHGDLFRDNVLWNGDRIAALLDFESASQGVFMYDLLVTVLAWCYGDGLDAALAHAMFRGYEEIRPITAAERRGALAEGAIACLRFATTRITDFSLRAGPGETPARDYRRFLGRLEALEHGALSALL